MIFLLYFLRIVSSASETTFGKLYSKGGGDSLPFNICKAFMGSIVFGIIALIFGFSFHLPTILLSTLYGVSLCLAMHAGFKALATGPMALTSTIASFSLIIPFFFGVFVLSEAFTWLKGVGLLFLLTSIVLITAKKESGFSVKWLIYSLLTLLANGVTAIVQKIHQIKFPGQFQFEFMFWGFLTVFLILILTGTVSKKETQNPFKISLLGISAGALNGVANYIVLYLSSTENASVIFPIVSGAHIMATWLIGVFFFGEKLKPIKTLGLILGIAAIVLLKL